MLSLREVMAKEPARGQMSLSCGSTDSRGWAWIARVNRRPDVKEEIWLCMSQICKDRYVFFFDCSEEADRGIDHSDFSG